MKFIKLVRKAVFEKVNGRQKGEALTPYEKVLLEAMTNPEGRKKEPPKEEPTVYEGDVGTSKA